MSRFVSYNLLSEIELCDELENSLQANVLHLLDDGYVFLITNPFLEIESTSALELIHLSAIKIQNEIKYLFKKEISILFPSVRNDRVCIKNLDCFNTGEIFKQIDMSHQSIIDQLKILKRSVKNLIETSSINNMLLTFLEKMKMIEDSMSHLIYIEQTYLFPKLKTAVNG